MNRSVMGKGRKNHHKVNGRKVSLAEQADKHILYEKAVQCVEAEIDFIDQTFQQLRGRLATALREDFCGTTNTSCEWIKRRDANTAYCVDIDPDVLDWGRQHHIAGLSENQLRRIHIVNDDVMKAETEPVDAALAMNFSYWVFKDRTTMKQYFKRVHDSLNDDGIFFLDAFGGYEAFQELEESTKYNGFTYIWDQAHYNPITGDALMHIHFKFKDGSRLNKAFTYHWRQWTLPELTEMLEETGFKASVYWEGEDEEGEGNGIYSPTNEGTADAGWVAYIVAEK